MTKRPLSWRSLFSRFAEQSSGDGPPLPSLEIHVPISPTDHFFTMIHFLAASLRAHGGALSSAPIIVTVGGDCEPADLYSAQPWSRNYPIKWVWLARSLYREKIYYATAVERFRHHFESDLVLMLDADMIVMRPFDDLVRQVALEKYFGGFIAHVSPFMMHNRQNPGQTASNKEWWHQLFSPEPLTEHRYRFEHTGWKTMFTDPDYRFCPPYFNLGFLIAPAEQMRKIGAVIDETMAQVDQTLTTIYKCQLALTLALCRLEIPVRPLAARYNYPNIDAFRSAYPQDFSDIRILHYLANDQIDKQRDFQSVEKTGYWLKTKRLTQTNRLLRNVLRPLYGQIKT
ncbi:MAG TPA: hypothetical protein DEP05_08385, partial [Betaproteobacteria bacterium]|nr:hypothetical protein [Betaproteobacteria bacterium]